MMDPRDPEDDGLDDFQFDDEDEEPFDVGGPGDDYIPDETGFLS